MSSYFFLAFALASLKGAVSFHGASLHQLPASSAAASKSTSNDALPLPLSATNPSAHGNAAGDAWGQLPWVSAPNQGSLLVPPRAPMNSKDRVGVALPELKIQSFGRKAEDSDDASKAAAAAIARGGAFKAASSFFQMDLEQGFEPGDGSVVHHEATIPNNSEGPKLPPVTPELQVGEVVADRLAPAQDNSTALDLRLGVGFVAAAQPPPALSEVLPLPFMPDGLPELSGHIHVGASIATQNIGISEDAQKPPSSGLTILGLASKANISMEDQDEAWSSFAAAEALTESNRGHSHDTEALTMDIAGPPLPAADGKPGSQFANASSSSLSSAHSPSEESMLAAAEAVARPAAAEESMLARHSVLVLWLLAISTVALVGGLCLACLGAGFLASFEWQKRNGSPTTRSQVEELPLCRASEVERRLPRDCGYDCTLSKPLSSGQVLRLEARVEGPAAGNVSLTTPLTGQACVVFSVAVSRQLHDGIRPAPVAFASGSVDFVISLKDAPHVRINVHTDAVSLFDMCKGRRVQQQSFAAAPDKWQDFILTHRAGTEWQTSKQMRSDSSCLEFEECALLCGTVATFVGELHRGSDGILALKPLQQDDSLTDDFLGLPEIQARPKGSAERWRTSWECVDNVASQPATPREEAEPSNFARVLVSDDPLLLDGANWILSGAASMLRKLPSKASSRAMTVWNQYRGAKCGGS